MCCEACLRSAGKEFQCNNRLWLARAPSSASHSSPDFRIRPESDQRSAVQVQKAAVIRHRLAPKKTAQQRERVVRQCLVDERMLPLQCLGGAAAWLLIVIECRIDNFREEF